MEFTTRKTFRFKVDQPHLYMIVSDTEQSTDKILLLSLKTWRDDGRTDPSCRLHQGDHPAVRHPSCISYRHALILSLDQLNDLSRLGHLTAHEEPLDPEVLKRILKGAEDTDQLSIGAIQLLRNQGLID